MASNSDGSVTINVGLSKEEFEEGLSSIKKDLNSLGKSSTTKAIDGIASSFKTMGSFATSAGKACSTVTTAVTGVLTAAAVKAKNFISVYESAKSIFERKLGSTGADEMYNQLLNIAKGSRYAQEYIVSAGQTLVAMGVDASHTAKYIQVATDAMSGMGKSGTEVEAMAEMFGKMSIQTTLYTEDLNQMLTSGIRVYDILAKKYNTSTSAIKEMASAGELTSKDFEYLMDVLSGSVEGMEEFSMAGLALAGKTGTLTGALDSLNTSFRSFALNLLGMNINKGQMDNYQKLIEVVSLLGTTLENVGSKFSFVSDWISSALDKIKSALTSFNELLDNTDSSTLQTIAKVVLGLATAGPILLATGKGFSVLGNAFSGLSKVNSVVEKFSSSIGSFASSGLNKISSLLSGNLGKILTSVNGFSTKFLSVFSSAFKITAVIGIVVAGLGLLQSTFGEQINSLLNTVTEKGPEVITNFVTGIVSKLPDLIAMGSTLLNNLLNAIITNLPAIISGGAQIISSLVSGLASQLPMLIPTAVNLILTIANSLIENLPTIIEAGLQLLVCFVQGIVNALPQLIAYIPTIITTVCNIITQELPNILQAGITILVSLINGLVDAIPQLVDTLPTIIDTIIDVIVENLPVIIDAGIEILMALIDGIAEAIPELVIAIPTIITHINNAIIKNLPKILEAGIKILDSLIEGILSINNKINEACLNIINSIWEGIKDLSSKAEGWGRDAIQGFINGIKSMVDKVKKAASNIASKIKEFLHFSRPDTGPLRDYEEWMPDMINGLTKTLNNASPKLYNASKELAQKVANGLNMDDVYSQLSGAVELEQSKLNANLTSNQIMTIKREDSKQATLQSIDNNREIVNNNTLVLDGKVVAESVNKVNARQKLQYGR